MRALAPALLFAFSVLCTTGCVNEDPIPAYMSVAYQLRCLGTCYNAADNPPHSFYHVDGEDDLDVRCEVSRAGGKDVLSFSTSCPGGNAACGKERSRFEVSGLEIGGKGGDPGDTCEVVVREGANEYSSPCTNGPIQGNDRCQVDFKLNADESLVTGSLRCEEITNANSPDITRYLVAPSSSKAIKFTVQGCEGL